jgi:hypothetical protein
MVYQSPVVKSPLSKPSVKMGFPGYASVVADSAEDSPVSFRLCVMSRAFAVYVNVVLGGMPLSSYVELYCQPLS